MTDSAIAHLTDLAPSRRPSVSAIDELIRIWHEPLWKYVRRMADDDEAARELTQAMLRHAHRTFDRLTERRRQLESRYGTGL